MVCGDGADAHVCERFLGSNGRGGNGDDHHVPCAQHEHIVTAKLSVRVCAPRAAASFTQEEACYVVPWLIPNSFCSKQNACYINSLALENYPRLQCIAQADRSPD